MRDLAGYGNGDQIGCVRGEVVSDEFVS